MSLGHVTSRFAGARAATVDEWFVSQLGYKRNVEVITMNFTSVVAAIPGTQRVATIHRRLAEYFARYLPIRLVDAPFAVPRLAEALQWHRHFNTDPGACLASASAERCRSQHGARGRARAANVENGGVLANSAVPARALYVQTKVIRTATASERPSVGLGRARDN